MVHADEQLIAVFYHGKCVAEHRKSVFTFAKIRIVAIAFIVAPLFRGTFISNVLLFVVADFSHQCATLK
jgi:hypothetical protein